MDKEGLKTVSGWLNGALMALFLLMASTDRSWIRIMWAVMFCAAWLVAVQVRTRLWGHEEDTDPLEAVLKTYIIAAVGFFWLIAFTDRFWIRIMWAVMFCAACRGATRKRAMLRAQEIKRMVDAKTSDPASSHFDPPTVEELRIAMQRLLNLFKEIPLLLQQLPPKEVRLRKEQYCQLATKLEELNASLKECERHVTPGVQKLGHQLITDVKTRLHRSLVDTES